MLLYYRLLLGQSYGYSRVIDIIVNRSRENKDLFPYHYTVVIAFWVHFLMQTYLEGKIKFE